MDYDSTRQAGISFLDMLVAVIEMTKMPARKLQR